MPCGAMQDGWVMVERSDRMWSTGEGKGKQLQYSFLESPMNSMKRKKDRTLKDELPRLGVQYVIPIISIKLNGIALQILRSLQSAA